MMDWFDDKSATTEVCNEVAVVSRCFPVLQLMKPCKTQPNDVEAALRPRPQGIEEACSLALGEITEMQKKGTFADVQR